jgi:hypothetical protein
LVAAIDRGFGRGDGGKFDPAGTVEAIEQHIITHRRGGVREVDSAGSMTDPIPIEPKSAASPWKKRHLRKKRFFQNESHPIGSLLRIDLGSPGFYKSLHSNRLLLSFQNFAMVEFAIN